MNDQSMTTGLGFTDQVEELVLLNDAFLGNVMHYDNINVTPVPEPGTLVLLVCGVAAMCARRRE